MPNINFRRIVTVQSGNGPINLFLELVDLTPNEVVMSFECKCSWEFIPGHTDPNRSRLSNDNASLNDCYELVKLSNRASDYNSARIFFFINAISYLDKTHNYRLTFTTRQNDIVKDVWSEDRQFESVDAFGVNYTFIH